jgi:hypothetical protein
VQNSGTDEAEMISLRGPDHKTACIGSDRLLSGQRGFITARILLVTSQSRIGLSPDATTSSNDVHLQSAREADHFALIVELPSMARPAGSNTCAGASND